MSVKTVVCNTDLGNTLYVDDSKKVNVSTDNKTIVVKDGKIQANPQPLTVEVVPDAPLYSVGEDVGFTVKVTNTSASVYQRLLASVTTQQIEPYAAQIKDATLASEVSSGNYTVNNANTGFRHVSAPNKGLNYVVDVNDLQPSDSVQFKMEYNCNAACILAVVANAQVWSGQTDANIVHNESQVIHVVVG